MFRNTGGSRNTRGTDTRISDDKQPQNRDHTIRIAIRLTYALLTGHGGRLKLSTGDSVWAPGVGGDRARA
jgi:hypothetical protein